MTDEDLCELCSLSGERVVSAIVRTQRHKSLSTGNGVAKFESNLAAVNVINFLNDKIVNGREVKAELVDQTTSSSNSTPTYASVVNRSRQTKKPTEETRANTSSSISSSKQTPTSAKTTPSTSTSTSTSASAIAIVSDVSSTSASTISPRNTSLSEQGKPISIIRPKDKNIDNKIYVGNLPAIATDEDLREIFTDFDVISAHIVRNIEHKGDTLFGFVEFSSPQEAVNAIDDVTGTLVEGFLIELLPAKQFKPQARSTLLNEEMIKESLLDISTSERSSNTRYNSSQRNTSSTSYHTYQNNRANREVDPLMVLVTDLPKETRKSHLLTAFSHLHPTNANVFMKAITGFAFVEFERVEDTKKAVAMKEIEILGKLVQIKQGYRKVEF